MPANALVRRRNQRPSPRALEAYRRHIVEGVPQKDIAADLGISRPRACQLIAVVERWIVGVMSVDIERAKAAQTVRLEDICDRALRAFERSCQDAVTKKTKLADGAAGKGQSKTAEQTSKGQSGNPALLAQARESLADIRRIWGLDAPEKIANTTADGEDISDDVIMARLVDLAGKSREPIVIDAEFIEGAVGHLGGDESP